MKKKGIQFATIIAGLLVMISIVCTNVLLVSVQTEKVATKTEQKADDSNAEYISAPAAVTVPGPFTVELNLQVYCLFEVCSGLFQPQESEPESQSQPQRYLLTLFRVIISPNAP